jgi:acyl carrier protein
MTTSDRVMKTILLTIDEFNEQLPEEKRIPKATDTVLFGESGHLDSVGLLNLIVEAEESVEAEFGIPIILADERAMAQESNPFETVASLVAYIAKLLEESENG